MRALLFPGQGAQKAAVVQRFLAGYRPLVEPILQEVDKAIPELHLSRLLTESVSNVDINATEIAQPLLVAAGYISFRVLQESQHARIENVCGVGHSIGEYTALTSAGALPLSSMLNIVHTRGKLMKKCCSPLQGMTMLIDLKNIGITDKILAVCAENDVQVASYNTPSRTVISGLKQNISSAVAELKSLYSVKSLDLKVSGAFHSKYMLPAAQELQNSVKAAEWKMPLFPVISNLTGLPYTSIEEIKKNLIDSMTRPVLLTQSLQVVEEVIDMSKIEID